MPPWDNFEPFIVSGLALGGVYALSGVGLVVQSRSITPYRMSVSPMVATALISGSRLARAGPNSSP